MDDSKKVQLARYVEEYGMACAGAAKALGEIRELLAGDSNNAAARASERALLQEIEEKQKRMQDLLALLGRTDDLEG
ncbi:MAG: hypothetical protein M3R24_25415 [Chloroflexota bacterium]|nr:hypothetical protein [Chloroflexota bacterium]PLS82960.1 MAG: hypothetical protein CYG59_02530 [Chloroflexota bacterium]